MGTKFIIARSSRGAPTLMHRLSEDYRVTTCGTIVTGWSRAYLDAPIAEVLCKRCGRVMLAENERSLQKPRHLKSVG